MTQQSLLGKQIGEYKLETLLGEGGMAAVYRALDVRLNRYVAVKVIHASFRSESEYKVRFEREAQAIAQLEHPNIITIYRYDELDNLLYMIMQYVDGADLSDVIESYHSDGAFVEFEEIIRLAHEIGGALDYAHDKGVIHRDIKPQNVLIRQDGHAIVSDFGLALLTEIGTRGEIFGSPHYIAPEQAISSAGAVPQSDLYALGIILYEMLTGSLPFDAQQPLDIAMKHMSDKPPAPRSLRPELSQEVEDVILKALSKDPQDRYQSGKELARVLENALTERKSNQQSSSKTRQTIPQRVALQVEANPLPPLPPQVIQPTPTDDIIVPSSPVATSSGDITVPSVAPVNPVTRKSASKTSRRPFAGAIIGIVILMIMVAILLLLSSSADKGSPEITLTQVAGTVGFASNVTAFEVADTNTSTSIPTVVPSTNTAVPLVVPPISTVMPIVVPPTSTIIPTVMPPTNTPQPVVQPTQVPTVQTWTLTIRMEKNSLFVLNDSTMDLPLASLQFNGEGSLIGSEWEVEELSTGQCVAVWKDDKKAKKYKAEDSDCQLIGEPLTRKKHERFWESNFIVSYQGQIAEICTDSPCVVEVTS